jgi:hypothetical protein
MQNVERVLLFPFSQMDALSSHLLEFSSIIVFSVDEANGSDEQAISVLRTVQRSALIFLPCFICKTTALWMTHRRSDNSDSDICKPIVYFYYCEQADHIGLKIHALLEVEQSHVSRVRRQLRERGTCTILKQRV